MSYRNRRRHKRLTTSPEREVVGKCALVRVPARHKTCKLHKDLYKIIGDDKDLYGTNLFKKVISNQRKSEYIQVQTDHKVKGQDAQCRQLCCSTSDGICVMCKKEKSSGVGLHSRVATRRNFPNWRRGETTLHKDGAWCIFDAHETTSRRQTNSVSQTKNCAKSASRLQEKKGKPQVDHGLLARRTESPLNLSSHLAICIILFQHLSVERPNPSRILDVPFPTAVLDRVLEISPTLDPVRTFCIAALVSLPHFFHHNADLIVGGFPDIQVLHEVSPH